MCWSSFSRDRTSISAPSRGLIFIRSCSALRRDKSSGQQRTGSCSHGFISRCNSIILGVDGYRPNQMFRNECVLHVVGVVGVNVSFPSSCLPSSGRWRDLSQQTSVRWNSHRNANSCKQLFMLFLLWHWALSSCTFMSKTMLTLSEHLCVWPCFFVGKLRAAGSVTRWRPSLLKWTLWLISASSCGRGWGRKKSKVRANSRLQLNSVRLTYLYRRLPPDPRPRLDFVRETRPGTSPGFKGGAWHPVPSHSLTKGCCPLLPRKHESHQVYYLFLSTVMDIFSVLLFTFPLQ